MNSHFVQSFLSSTKASARWGGGRKELCSYFMELVTKTGQMKKFWRDSPDRWTPPN
jgi:hypothetical protein